MQLVKKAVVDCGMRSLHLRLTLLPSHLFEFLGLARRPEHDMHVLNS